MRQAAEGVVDAREEFARQYEPTIRAYLKVRWREGLPSLSVDDAVQDVFVEFYRSQGALEKANERIGGDFKAYLVGIVRNVAMRHEQKKWKHQHDPISESIKSDDSSVATALDRAWAQSLLKEATLVQEETAREIGEEALRRVDLLRLRFQDGLPIREIAHRWGKADHLVHREYAKARKEFKDALRTVVACQHPDATDAQLDAMCRNVVHFFKSNSR